jgi:hypothetical protein
MLARLKKLDSRFLSSIPVSIILFGFFFSLYVFTIYGQIRYGDEAERYLQAKSLVEKQTLVIPFIPGEGQTGVGGNAYSQFEMGYGLVVVPFYALGRLVSNQLAPVDADWIPVLFTNLSNPLITALTCVILFEFARAVGLTSRLAIWTTLVFGLATLAWPYSKGLYREALQGFCLLWAVYAIHQARSANSWKWLWVSASAFGFLVLTKTVNLIMLPIFLGYIAFTAFPARVDWKSPSKWTHGLKEVIVFLIPVTVCLGFQGVINVIKFGNFFVTSPDVVYSSPSQHFSLWNLPGGLDVLLFSPDKSLLLYAPPALLFVPAWSLFFRKNRRDALFTLAIIVSILLFYGSYTFGEGRSYWGPRYLVEIIPLLALPLGFLWETGHGLARWFWRLLSIVVFGIGTGVQLLGALTNDREYLDVTGQWIDIPGALDFLRHGGIDSLMFSLAPQGKFEISPCGWFLISCCLLYGLLLIVRARVDETGYPLASRWNSAAMSLIAIGLPFGDLVGWMMPTFAATLAAKGNTKYVAAESFFADGRFCEAKGFYSEALYFGSDYSKQSASRLGQITPGAVGTEIEVGDLVALGPGNDSVTIAPDSAVALFGDGALKIAAPLGKQVDAEADSRFIPVDAGIEYEFSGWVRTMGVAGDGAAIVGWYEDNGKWKNPRTLDVFRTSGTHGWLPFKQLIVTLPMTQRVLLKASLWQSYGTVWIERLRLVQVDAERSTQVRPLCAP